MNRSRVRPPREVLVWLVVTRGLSDVAIAQLCGVAPPTVRRWRRGYGIAQPASTLPIGRQELAHLYVDQLLPLTAVAAKLGTSVQTVRGWMRRYGIPPRQRGRIPGGRYLPAGRLPDDQTLARMYAAGWSVKPLAARYGVSPTTIADRLKAAGTQLRPRGRHKGQPRQGARR